MFSYLTSERCSDFTRSNILQIKHKLVSENGAKFFILIKNESTTALILHI